MTLAVGPGILGSGDDRTTALSELIQDNHNTYGLLYAKVTHNHVQHALSAAYQLGSSKAHLVKLYEAEQLDLVPWGTRPTGRVTSENELHQRLGDLDCERDFVRFFEEELRRANGNWQSVLQYYLIDSPRPLFTGVVGGFAHPLILLSDAIELGSPTLAMDSLALTAVDYNAMHKILEAPLPSVASAEEVLTPLAVLEKLRAEAALAGVLTNPGIKNMQVLLSSKDLALALAKYLPLAPSSGTHDDRLKALAVAALHLLMGTHVPGNPAFDFYLNHSLTFCNTLRILLPVFPEAQQDLLFRAQWLMTIMAYSAQLRPTVDASIVASSEAKLSWAEIKQVALGENDKRDTDPHYLKAIQNMETFGKLWPDVEELFLKGANKFVADFEGWTGFGSEGEPKMNIR